MAFASQTRWGENPTSQSLRRGLCQGLTGRRTGPRQSVAAAGLGAPNVSFCRENHPRRI
jgi:hypothetical protein